MSYNVKEGVKNNKTEFFETPKSIVDQLYSLLPVKTDDLTVFDSCTGTRSLTKDRPFKKVINWDLEPRDEKVEKHNSLVEDWPKADLLVCNPPFTKTKEFKEKAKGKYRYELWITTYGRAKKWQIDNYIGPIVFSKKVRSRVVLIFIDNSTFTLNKKKTIEQPRDPKHGMTIREWRLFFIDLFNESRVVTVKEAEECQDTHYITTFFVSGKRHFLRTFKETRDLIKERYNKTIDEWIAEKPNYHKLVATPKSFYDRVTIDEIDGYVKDSRAFFMSPFYFSFWQIAK